MRDTAINLPRRPRLDSLTGLRWFAAFAVFLFHSNQRASIPKLQLFDQYGDAGVAFFFILSGFVLTWSFNDKTTKKVFFWRRFARIWPALLVTTIFSYFALQQVFGKAAQAIILGLTLTLAWHTNTTLVGNPVAWSLSAEAFFYLLFPFVIRPILRSRPAVLAFLAALMVGIDIGFRKLSFDYYLPHHQDLYHLLMLERLPVYRAVEFILGVVLAAAMVRGWRPRIPVSVASLVIALDLVAMWWANRQGWLGEEWSNQLLTPAFGLMIVAVANRDLAGKRSILRSRPLVALGEWSYSFYLIHVTVIFGMLRYYPPVRHATWLNLKPLLLWLSISLVLSWLCYQFVERPAEKWLRNRVGPRPEAESESGAQSRPAARLGWLDALRGIAAITVVMHHFGLLLLVPHGKAVALHFDLGVYGVMLFFLISGYIVPASLEKRGDVRGFWLGRYFRIYPVLIFTVVFAFLLLGRHNGVLRSWPLEHPLIGLTANFVMLQDLLHVPNLIDVMWTLCYEMVFYYLVTALFVFKQHRRSSMVSVGFAAVALVLGGALTPVVFSDGLTAVNRLVAAATLVVAMGMACLLSGRPGLTRTGAFLLAGLGLLLAFTNGRAAPFETMMIFATMFAGTAIHRAERGQIGRLEAALCCGFVLAAGFLSSRLYNQGGTLGRSLVDNWQEWSFAYLGAWATFAVALALRNRRFPTPLTWLGTVSYSVYLLHLVLMDAIHWHPWSHEGMPIPRSGSARLLLTVTFLAVLLVLAYLTYRFVEVPFQNLGRRLLKLIARRSVVAPQQTGPAAEQVDEQMQPAGVTR